MRDPDDRPLDRSTASLNDPLPHTAAAAQMRDALPDTTVRPDAVQPLGLVADTHTDLDDRVDDGAADHPGDEIGEAVGGISGVLTGAALGSLGGPIGTIIGGIAGAVSGWWAGRAISESAYHATHQDDEFYRGRHAAATPERSYDDVRPAYQLGHVAGRNPDYAGRTFDEVEGDLRHGWNDDVSTRHGSWDQVRGYARAAFERSRETASATPDAPHATAHTAPHATSTPAPGVGGPSATVVGGAASGSAATGNAAGTATGGTATEGSRAAPATGSLDETAASRGSGI